MLRTLRSPIVRRFVSLLYTHAAGSYTQHSSPFPSPFAGLAESAERRELPQTQQEKNSQYGTHVLVFSFESPPRSRPALNLYSSAADDEGRLPAPPRDGRSSSLKSKLGSRMVAETPSSVISIELKLCTADVPTQVQLSS